MNDRQQELLQCVVEAYSERAQPVGSQLLVQRYKFPYSSATIRNDLAVLEEEGYLTQPHTSAGRVPTEKGYRFYIQNCVGTPLLAKRDAQQLAEVFEQDEELTEDVIKELARRSAEILNSAILVGLRSHDVYYTGLTNLFRQPEFSHQATVIRVSSVIDVLDAAMEDIRSHLEEEPITILIGQENPFGPSCTVILTQLPNTGSEVRIIGVLGPLRLNYPRALAAMHFMHDQFERYG